VPRARSASIINRLSRECSGAIKRVGSVASALSTSSRLVRDFEPGSETVAFIGPLASGAGQGEPLGE
jgi:hypothetical protein